MDTAHTPNYSLVCRISEALDHITYVYTMWISNENKNTYETFNFSPVYLLASTPNKRALWCIGL